MRLRGAARFEVGQMTTKNIESLCAEDLLALLVDPGLIPLPYAYNSNGTTYWSADAHQPGDVLVQVSNGYRLVCTEIHTTFYNFTEASFAQCVPMLQWTDRSLRRRFAARGISIPDALQGGPVEAEYGVLAWHGILSRNAVHAYEFHPLLKGRSLAKLVQLVARIASVIDPIKRGSSALPEVYAWDIASYGMSWFVVESAQGAASTSEEA